MALAPGLSHEMAKILVLVVVRVVAPHFIASILVNERGVCVQAPHNLQWCVGCSLEDLRKLFSIPGWSLEGL